MLALSCFFIFFFFSSRRRHTRCSRDWSSDVCSSDLVAVDQPGQHGGVVQVDHPGIARGMAGDGVRGSDLLDTVALDQNRLIREHRACAHESRSEEHTSELQSRLHLVCRLLLEKKK